MEPEPISFRSLQRSDLSLVAGWLTEPLVARWWNHDAAPEAVEAYFGPGVDGEDGAEYFLALLGERPIGLIQRYRIDAFPDYVQELSAVIELPAAALSIDYLVGEPSARGRGLGAVIIASFLEQTWAAFPDTRDVIVPIVAGNRASWRSLENAGFVRIAEVEMKPDNPLDPPDHLIYHLPRPALS